MSRLNLVATLQFKFCLYFVFLCNIKITLLKYTKVQFYLLVVLTWSLTLRREDDWRCLKAECCTVFDINLQCCDATVQHCVQQRENRCGCFRFSVMEEESQELRGGTVNYCDMFLQEMNSS